MSHRDYPLAIVLAGALASVVAAHPPDTDGHHDEASLRHSDPSSLRAWTSLKTGEVVRGAFLSARTVDGSVRVVIERENGDVVVFTLAELIEADRTEAQRRIDETKAINQRLAVPAAEKAGAKPPQAAPFDAFAPFVRTRWDDRWLFVESDGLPHEPLAHPLMVGIRAWQQQVPLPQAYSGDNAWRFPLRPELADAPVSAKNQLFRGAIAIAANGVPIFNPIKNDGHTDTFLAGELDEFGGHSGRADDYHYHTAPLALQKVLGKDKPLAYALDGFPIYGLFDPSAKVGDDMACPLGGTEKLDDLNGHFAPPATGAEPGTKGLYHASVAYPYLNGGMRGKVVVKDDQIDPQPRANPVRESGTPLRGASITGFKRLGGVDGKSWSLEYTLGGKNYTWNYRIEGAKYIFEFVDPDGAKKTQTYAARSRSDRPPVDTPPPTERPRPRRGSGRDGKPGDQIPPLLKAPASDFTLTSPAVGVNGRLPAEFTCDGAGISPPLAWAKPPAGTQSFAVTMHHIPGPPRPGDKPGEDKHVYLVLYNIPATTISLDKGLKSAGEGHVSTAARWGWGVNTVNRRAEYAPPCSKGPGEKTYTLTVYALSKEVAIQPTDSRGATMDELLAAIKDSTLGTATLDVTYARPSR